MNIVKRVIGLLLVAVYLLVRFPFGAQLDQLGLYASYIFEAVFVTVVGLVYWKTISFRPNWSRHLLLHGVVALVAGLGIFQLTKVLGLPVPFALNSTETLVFLLVIGPVLEELIFRMALWEATAALIMPGLAPLIFTTALFSFAHFFAYTYVPDEFKNFVLYQSAYTLVLGFHCGYWRRRTGSVTPAIVIHALFNLGFFFGSLFSSLG